MNSEAVFGQNVPISDKLDSITRFSVGLSMFRQDLDSSSNNPNIAFEESLLTVLLRAISLSTGFRLLIEERLCQCAASLVRQQLDNALYLTATLMVDDPNKLAKQLKEKVELRDIHSSNHVFLNELAGKKLKTKNLLKYASHRDPELSDNFKLASNFIHYSYIHLHTVSFENINLLEESVCGDMISSEAELASMIDAFIDYMLYIYDWFDDYTTLYRFAKDKPWALITRTEQDPPRKRQI